MTDDELRAIEERAEKVGSEWETWIVKDDYGFETGYLRLAHAAVFEYDAEDAGIKETAGEIAKMLSTDIPALLKEVKGLRAENERANKDRLRMDFLEKKNLLIRAGWEGFGEEFVVSYWKGDGFEFRGKNPRAVIDAATAKEQEKHTGPLHGSKEALEKLTPEYQRRKKESK